MRDLKKAAGFLAVVFAVLAITAAPTRATETTVKIENFTFEPQVLTVPVGTKVTWVNDDDIPHLVAEKDGKFRSAALDTNDTYSETFSTPGTIEYYCAIHPHMTGKIVVTQ